jgi:hypothetical protein
LKKNLGFNSTNTLRTAFQLILLPPKDKKQVQVALAFQELAFTVLITQGPKNSVKLPIARKKHSFKSQWPFF